MEQAETEGYVVLGEFKYKQIQKDLLMKCNVGLLRPVRDSGPSFYGI